MLEHPLSRGEPGPDAERPNYYLVNLGNARDWGVMINEGTAAAPAFRVLFKATRSYAEQLLVKLNQEPKS